MKAADVMVTNVITVGPDAGIREVANTLLANRISAVPVVGERNELLGIVSEGDLMRRSETDTERHRSWWIEQFTSNETLASEFTKSHSRKVTDIMTRDVVTAEPSTSLGDVAALLEKNAIKRVPIVRDRKVVGIVSRANLVQALASVRNEIDAATAVDDPTVREKVMTRLKAQRWAGPFPLNVIVNDGTVELWGLVDSEDAKRALRVVAEETAGVQRQSGGPAPRPRGMTVGRRQSAHSEQLLNSLWASPMTLCDQHGRDLRRTSDITRVRVRLHKTGRCFTVAQRMKTSRKYSNGAARRQRMRW